LAVRKRLHERRAAALELVGGLAKRLMEVDKRVHHGLHFYEPLWCIGSYARVPAQLAGPSRRQVSAGRGGAGRCVVPGVVVGCLLWLRARRLLARG
jgi:hypothetical protein